VMVPERNSVRRDECITVVGVLEGFWRGDILDRDKMLVYVPRVQRRRAFSRPTWMYVSASGDRDAVASTALAVRKTVQSVRSDLPAATITLLRDRAEPQMRPWRLGAMMFTLFGVVALIIAVVGLYGVVSFAAAQRSKEVAIRVALGARAGHVLSVIAGEGVAAVVAGLLFGTVAAALISTWVGKLLFQTSARDPVIFLGVGVLLLVVAAVASVVPTRQVLKRSAAAVLRTE
jgi:putative ABC transport system permease protein